MSDLLIIKCTVGRWRENSYLVSNNNGSFVVDPGDEFEKIDGVLIDKSLPPLRYILATHGHFDHVGAIEEFKVKYKIPFGIHSKDKRILNQANLYRKMAGDNNYSVIPKIDFKLEDINDLSFGESKILIHHTPGHSHGSVSLEIGKNLFVGDILLHNEIGRTDLPGGDKEKIGNSVKYILENFTGYTIYPGHGTSFFLNKTKRIFFESLL